MNQGRFAAGEEKWQAGLLYPDSVTHGEGRGDVQ